MTLGTVLNLGNRIAQFLAALKVKPGPATWTNMDNATDDGSVVAKFVLAYAVQLGVVESPGQWKLACGVGAANTRVPQSSEFVAH